MAALTVGGEIDHFASQWRSAGIKVKRFSGTGTDDSTIASAVADSRYVVVGGRCSINAPARMDILSGSTVIDSIEFAARATARFPVGLECNTNEDLKLNQSGTDTVRGWIAYALIKEDQTLPQVDIAQ